MPFKSEAQRKYLWANEPEIARDWTDTYGSGIQAAQGGRIGFRRGTSGAPGGGDPGMTSDPSGRGQTFGGTLGGGGWSPGVGGTQHIPTPKVEPDRGFYDYGKRQIKKTPSFLANVGVAKKLNIPYLLAAYGTNYVKDKFQNRDKGTIVPSNQLNEMGMMSGIKNIGSSIYDFLTPGVGPETDTVTDTVIEEETPKNPSLGTHLLHPEAAERQEEANTAWDTFYKENPEMLPSKAQGGLIGSVGGISRPKYQQGNMVGAEMEGAVMQSQEVIKDLYDALIAQGLSPQEAMEEIKRMLSGIRPEEGAEEWPRSPEQGAPQGPMPQLGRGLRDPGQQMSPGPAPRREFPRTQSPAWPGGRELLSEDIGDWEFPEGVSEADKKDANLFLRESGLAGGGRVPAAFGGIMDTYTGRRKYSRGQLVQPGPGRPGYGGLDFITKPVKKILKKAKKLASSKLGKLALMYAAGTYLGGTAAFGGTGWGSAVGQTPWKKFGAQLLNPMGKQGIGNVFRPKGWSMFQKAPQVSSGVEEAFRKEAFKNTDPSIFWEMKNAPKAATSLMDKIPGGAMTAIGLPSVAAGLYTAKQPPEELGGEVTDEWETGKSDFDKYLASLNADYSVDPSLLKSAQGGRVGRQEGGLMNLGGMEKDYRNDGGFVPLGGEEKADDVPARLSRNEFVFTADAVRNAGGGDIDRGAEVMENVMKNLEGGGKISEESQGQGAQEMFETSERLSEVV
jgi:hypothetical protein